MKRLSMLLLFSAILMNASAQVSDQPAKQRTHQKQHREFKKHKKGNLYKNLNLSETQKAEMKANNEDYKKKEESLKNQPGITLKNYQEGKAKLQKDREEKEAGILSPDQKAQMQQMKKDRQAKSERRQKMKMERMTKDLSLSADQVSRMNAQNDLTRQQLNTINQNDKLTIEQKRAEAKKINREARKNKEAILTPEQQQKWNNRKNNKAATSNNS